jgi:hypothetical protein
MGIMDAIRKALGRSDDSRTAEPPVGSMTPERKSSPASSDRDAATDAAANSRGDVSDAASGDR